MTLYAVALGTALTILECTPDNEAVDQYEAKFIGTESRVSFLVEDEAFYDNAGYVRPGNHFKFQFLHDNRLYEFKGKVRGNITLGGQKLTQVNQISDIVEGTRRRSPRHKISTQVSVYETEAARVRGAILAQGDTLDISRDSLHLQTSHVLAQPDPDFRFLLEFTLGRRERFVLPSVLVRRSENPKTVYYKYDFGYIFLFDFGGNTAEQHRLVTALFQHKLSGLS